MKRCTTCGYQPPGGGLPSRLPAYACSACQDAYEDACERRRDEIRDRELEQEYEERNRNEEHPSETAEERNR